MTNAERWVAQYRALQKEMDLPVTRKLQPDRSAKNKTSVEAGVEGISDEYVELDAADDMRPATSNSNQVGLLEPLFSSCIGFQHCNRSSVLCCLSATSVFENVRLYGRGDNNVKLLVVHRR